MNGIDSEREWKRSRASLCFLKIRKLTRNVVSFPSFAFMSLLFFNKSNNTTMGNNHEHQRLCYVYSLSTS